MSCNAIGRGSVGLTLCLYLAACGSAGIKEGYLDQEFSPEKLPEAVQQSLSKLDRTPVKFHQMVLTVEPQLERSDGGSGSGTSYRNTYTLIDAGNGLVQTVDQRSQNGNPTAQTYALTYRSFLVLRSQDLAPSGDPVNPILATKALSHIEPFDPATSKKEIEFDSETGYAQQAAGISKQICKWGAVHPAADVFGKFTGDARDLDCRALDRNGTQVSHSKQAYLLDYGVAVAPPPETGAFKSDSRITAADIR